MWVYPIYFKAKINLNIKNNLLFPQFCELKSQKFRFLNKHIVAIFLVRNLINTYRYFCSFNIFGNFFRYVTVLYFPFLRNVSRCRCHIKQRFCWIGSLFLFVGRWVFDLNDNLTAWGRFDKNFRLVNSLRNRIKHN